MARASTVTWLSLDRFAEVVGLNPFHFNQLHGQGLLNYDLSCGSPWYQYDYQKTESVSRETLAQAIKRAEDLISQYAKYNLIPDWNGKAERILTRRLRDPGLVANIWNARGMQRSVELLKGYYIEGGIKTKTLIVAGAAIVATDADGDGFAETCTVTFAADEDPCEIHVYLPSRAGADNYEIRPVTVTDIGGGNYTAVFKRWQVVDPDLQDGMKPSALDHTVAANFETTVDIYRVYSDPDGQCTLYWEPDTTEVDFSTQEGMLAKRDSEMGIVTYRPATWDGTDFASSCLSLERDPDFIEVFYKSGYEYPQATCESTMDPFWEQAIAHFAIAEIDRDLCSCNNTEWMFQKWRNDLARVDDARSFNINPADLSNPFGTRWGALDAWRRVKERRLA